MVTKAQYNALVKVIGDSLSNEILMKSTKNLSSLEYSRETQMGYRYGKTKDKLPHNWTITNKGTLARSGYKKADRRRYRWEVGFDAPYAYYVNYGSGPGKNTPFANLYDWAYRRKKEIKKTFPDLQYPRKKDNPDYYKFLDRYQGKSLKGHRVEKIPFLFAYYVWAGIKKNGTPPTFFFSDAVYTSCRDAKTIIKRALRTKKTFVYDESTGSFSSRGYYAVES